MAPLYSCCSIHRSPSVHLPSIHRFIHPSLHPSIHLPALRPLHPLSIALFLFVVDAERVAQSPSGPNSQTDPWINSNIHLPPPALPPSSSNPAACAWAVPPVCFLLRIPTVDHVWVSAWNIQSHLDTFLRCRSGWISYVLLYCPEKHKLPGNILQTLYLMQKKMYFILNYICSSSKEWFSTVSVKL